MPLDTSTGEDPSRPARRRNGGKGVQNDDLDELERLLEERVDTDFFQDPKKFHTLHRVIDVLGAQLLENTSDRNTPYSTKEYENLRKHNPAYKALKKQQQVVEDAIEHLAVVHCAELNGSVVQVGRVARQFRDAVTKIRELRRQVNDIQETLGNSHSQPLSEDANGISTRDGVSAAAMSLRELWLKKLECEAVLTLLEKMEILRAAPTQFDLCVRPRNGGPCRIGSAVLTLSSALAIAFEHSVSHVAALHSITKQLLERQQIAEDIIWKTLQDVIYLRTGNGVAKQHKTSTTKPTPVKRIASSAASVSSKRSTGTSSILQNPFLPRQGKLRSLAEDEQMDDESVQSYDSADTSFFSKDSSTGSKQNSTATTAASSAEESNRGVSTRMMIPVALIDAELDLEADEQRTLENNFGVPNDGMWDRSVPRYADHVMALRILVECLAKLRRLADVERHLSEELHMELRRIAQMEQARTLARLERRSHKRHARDLKELRRHLTGLLSSFGCVMVRYSHLAQILRHRITTDKEPVLYDENGQVRDPASFMHHVLVSAFDFMQREIKDFLTACLKETEKLTTEDVTSNGISSYESGFFSLGITNDANKEEAGIGTLAASRANTMELPADQFVSLVLFPRTNNTPQVRHALEFRKALAKWASENDALKKELAIVSGQDTSSPSYQMTTEQTALDLLDSVIKKQLIPILQDDALNGTTHALERGDAFDPVIDRTLYGRPNSNEPQDVDMCVACQAVYYSTSPLFQALHRLPRDEKMYLHVVGVLEHAILTFISRIKPRVNQICNDKLALRFLLDSGKEGKDKSFNLLIERRRAFAQLLQAYADGDLLETTQNVNEPANLNNDSALIPLAPPTNDTKARAGGGNDPKSPGSAGGLDLVGSVEREEQNLILELGHLQSVLEYTKESYSTSITVCSDEELMKASCLAHSLLKLSSLLESRLRIRSGNFEKVLTSTRALREAIKTIKTHGIKMAKFCRIDMLLQTVTRLSKICKSSTLVAKDAVRIPSCVNDLGEYLTAASDNLREAAGNAVTAYTLSSLEQYIPLFLMQTVRVIAHGEGIVSKAPLTLNGIEALDRSGSVLYRDLKGSTSFDNSFWDDELAAISFERSASFMAMMELEVEELEAYYRANNEDFSEEDFKLMFAMNGPRRRGDIGRYHMIRKKVGPK